MELGALFRLILFNLLVAVKAYLSNSPHIITFWGQDPALQDATKVERALNKTCGPKSSYSTVVLGFVSKSIRNKTTASLPPMHCVKSTKSRSKLSLYCPEISKKVEQCKLNKKKVLIGVGGPNETLYFDDARSAQYFAKKIWNWFLGGTEISEMRPFGGISLDGVNIFLKDDKSKYVDVFLKTLNTLRNRVPDDADQKYVYTMSVPCNAPESYFGEGKNRLSLDKIVPIVKQIYVRYSGKQCCKNGPKHFRGELQEWKRFSVTKDRPALFVLFPRSPHKTMTNCFSSNRQLNILHNVVNLKTKLANFISKITSLYQTNVRWRARHLVDGMKGPLAHLVDGTEASVAHDKIEPRYVELNTQLSDQLLQLKDLFSYPNLNTLSRQMDQIERKLNEREDRFLFNDNYLDNNKYKFKKRSVIKESLAFKVPHMHDTEVKPKKSEIKIVLYVSAERSNKASSPKVDIDAIDLNTDGAKVRTPSITTHENSVTSNVDDMEVAGSGDRIVSSGDSQVTQYVFNDSNPRSTIDDNGMLLNAKSYDRNSKVNKNHFMPMLDHIMDDSHASHASLTRKKTFAKEVDETRRPDIKMELAGSDQSDSSLGDLSEPFEVNNLSVKKMISKYKADDKDTTIDALFQANDPGKTLGSSGISNEPNMAESTDILDKVKQADFRNALEGTSNINNYKEVLQHMSDTVRKTYLHNKLESTANIHNYKEALKHNDNVKLANSQNKDEGLPKQPVKFAPMTRTESNTFGDVLHLVNSNKDMKQQTLVAADHALSLNENLLQFTNIKGKPKSGKAHTLTNKNIKRTKHELDKFLNDVNELFAQENIGNMQEKNPVQIESGVQDSRLENMFYTNGHGKRHKNTLKVRLNNESPKFDNTRDISDFQGSLKEERDSTSTKKSDNSNVKDISGIEGKLKEEHRFSSNGKSDNSNIKDVSDIEGKRKKEPYPTSNENSDNLTLKMLMLEKYNPISLGDKGNSAALATLKRTKKTEKQRGYTTYHRMSVPSRDISRDYATSPSILDNREAHLRHRRKDVKLGKAKTNITSLLKLKMHHEKKKKSKHNTTVGVLGDRKYIIKRKDDEDKTLLGVTRTSKKSSEREESSLIDKINKYQPLIMSNINEISIKLKKQMTGHTNRYHKNNSFTDDLISDIVMEDNSDAVREPKKKPRSSPVVVTSSANLHKINKHKSIMSSNIDALFEHKFEDLRNQLKLHNITSLDRRDSSSIETMVHSIDEKLIELKNRKKRYQRKHTSSNKEDIELGPVIDYFDYMDNEQQNKKIRSKLHKLKPRHKGHYVLIGAGTLKQKLKETLGSAPTLKQKLKETLGSAPTLKQKLKETLGSAPSTSNLLGYEMKTPDIRASSIDPDTSSISNYEKTNSASREMGSSRISSPLSPPSDISFLKHPSISNSPLNHPISTSYPPLYALPTSANAGTDLKGSNTSNYNPNAVDGAAPSYQASSQPLPTSYPPQYALLPNANAGSGLQDSNTSNYNPNAVDGAAPSYQASSQPLPTSNPPPYALLPNANAGSDLKSLNTSSYDPNAVDGAAPSYQASYQPLPTSYLPAYTSPTNVNASSDLKGSNTSSYSPKAVDGAPPADHASSIADANLTRIAQKYVNSVPDPKPRMKALSHVHKAGSLFDSQHRRPNFYQRIKLGSDKLFEEFAEDNPYVNLTLPYLNFTLPYLMTTLL